jgi:hypothetical protein
MFICKNKPNVGKLYKIHRTVTFIYKNKPKTPISGHLPRVPVRSSAFPTSKFRPIQRYLVPDLAVGAPTAAWDALIVWIEEDITWPVTRLTPTANHSRDAFPKPY